LRNRFFAIIVAVILTVTTATISFHLFFLKQERLRLIDQQVRETAAALVDSSLVEVRKVDFETIDQIISEELGENRIGKFFIIRNADGEILFESTSAKVLPLIDIPQSPQWISLHEKGQFIRVLNLELPRIPDRSIQVGLVIGQELLSPSFFSRANLTFLLGVVSLGFAVAWFLTSTLLKPIRQLERFVSSVAKEPSAAQLPALPKELTQFSRATSNDEFASLLKGLQDLIDRVNLGYRLSRIWAYQMAHELKTPLAILSVELETRQAVGTIDSSLADVLKGELRGISDTVSSFLNWAELENSRQTLQPHANRIAKVLEHLTRRFEAKEPGRVIYRAPEQDFYVLCDPNHLEQTLQNLISNALKYSPRNETVVIETLRNSIAVSDRGSGMSPEVIDRLGEPFNKGTNALGHGLGLAWVMSVAKIYGWNVNLKSDGAGTTVEVKFPNGHEVVPDIEEDAAV
jgi:signal transduction histidine kinase